MQKAKFILSKSKALQQYNVVRELADEISYSSKTNQDITRILEKETDSRFSVHFFNELKHVQDMGRVIFLAQGWDEKAIKQLIEKGIRSFIVDNETDLDTLIAYIGKNDIPIELFLRLQLKENTLRTERYYVFGMKAAVVQKRIEQLHQIKNITSLGVHFHRKTQNMSEWNLSHELSGILPKDLLEKIDVVNIGGGLPSSYANTNMKVLDGIYRKITEFKQWLASHNVKLILEPGRFVAAPAVTLESTIIGIHENTIIVNASVYNSDLDAVVVPVKLLVKGEVSKDEGEPYVIKGITPCSMDLFRYRVYLKDPKIGDTITFLNAGAYNFTTDFCDLDKLETKIVE